MLLKSCHTRVGLGLAAILLATPALAALRDRGPVDPATGFPAWYRDNGIPAGALPAVPSIALQPCLSDNPSPNVVVGGAIMCFPRVADPAGFAGNFGPEAFYSVSDAALASSVQNFSIKLTTALEGGYATGTPVKGQEMVFARIRMTMNTAVAGTYTVVHPFGVEIFPNVPVGTRSLFFTADVGIVPQAFDLALGGRIGPFIRWDALAPGESLTSVNPVTLAPEQFIGDPNLLHTVTGSPFGTNFLRVIGPAGSGIGGPGVDTLETPLFTVVGRMYTAPIPTPLKGQRATYTRTAAASSVDVFAQASAGQQIVVSGAGIPTGAATGANGNYVYHSVLGAAALLPASVDVTNTTDVPPTLVTLPVTDLVSITDAAYDPATSILSVTATSSDASAAPPALTLSGFGALATGTFATAIGPVPPESVTVTSSAGGSATKPVRLAQTAVVVGTANVAANDTFTANFNTAAVFPVTANDTIAPPTNIAAIVITAPPAHGTAVAGIGAALGSVTYTPALNYSGPDSFTYVIQDSAGLLSNVATVSISVLFVPTAPVAVNDLITTTAGVPNTLAILANDTFGVGTSPNLASVVLSAVAPAAAGTLTWSAATGLVTFTPTAGFTGAASATYTVQNTAGQVSNSATISLQVNATAEIINITTAQFRTGTSRWTVRGTSTVATGTVTIYNGSTTAAPVIATGVPIVAGAFVYDAVGGPAPSASRLILIRSSNGGSRVAAVTVRQ
jgi:hypothetical protein